MKSSFDRIRLFDTARNRGFTIVEIMIVLAIGSLILSIILFALPAVARNTRNGQRKQEVQAILSAVSQYELNNSGNLPQSAAFLKYTKVNLYDKSIVKIIPPGPATTNGINVFIYGDWSSAPVVISGTTNTAIVNIYNYQKCETNTGGGSNNGGAGYNDVVALYAVENGKLLGGSQCQQI